MILELSHDIPYGPSIQPIHLPQANKVVPEGSALTISGWAASRVVEGELESSALKQAPVQKIHSDECRLSYPSLTDQMMCVDQSLNGTCVGDLGSPVTLNNVLVGVASYGVECGQSYFPMVVANVAAVVEWIGEVFKMT